MLTGSKMPRGKTLVALSIAIGALFGLAGPQVASAQDIRDKTVIFTFASGNGQIFVARSGNIFYIFENRARGLQFKLGQTIRSNVQGCQSQTSASLAGATLTLDYASTCPSISWTGHVVVAIAGDSCSLTNRMGVVSSSGPTTTTLVADSCRIVGGNHLAR